MVDRSRNNEKCEEAIFMARIAEKAGRYNDMVEYLKPIL